MHKLLSQKSEGAGIGAVLKVAAAANRFKQAAVRAENVRTAKLQAAFDSKLQAMKNDKTWKLLNRMKLECAKVPEDGREEAEVLDLAVLCHLLSPFFVEQPLKTKMELCKTVKYVQYRAGQVICKQGEMGDCFHVIATGKVDVLVRHVPHDIPVG
ncbi:hypothetical protein CYMTET_41075 [Cymbomonas tetramitiformis]|uniref:Cyclic nucleotide-binding domain-containing protein n=1 Tax=Cymbomonas tetramitiformis TaxID=36881 RepID=A0AAE0C914_9CHLO|nr:hypothetical protein CYMTET_41075 [Cymbomonas tetramitiformis]